MKYHNLNEINQMMANIIAEGVNEVWNNIEEETNAIKRCMKRRLFWKANKKLKKR